MPQENKDQIDHGRVCNSPLFATKGPSEWSQMIFKTMEVARRAAMGVSICHQMIGMTEIWIGYLGDGNGKALSPLEIWDFPFQRHFGETPWDFRPGLPEILVIWDSPKPFR